MDENTKLIVAIGGRTESWEDQERANDDLNVLIAEFQERLPVELPRPNASVTKRQPAEPASL